MEELYGRINGRKMEGENSARMVEEKSVFGRILW